MLYIILGIIFIVIVFVLFFRKRPEKSLRGKSVLITGAASGIGRLMAFEFAQEGARVLVLWDINQGALDAVEKELRQTGVNVKTFVCDVSKRANIYETASKVKSEVGKIDILVNNAGVVSGEFFLDLKEENIERVMNVNIMAIMWTIKSFLPDMVRENSGHLVTISSAGATCGVPKLADYCASKSAAFGFMESLRLEIQNKGWNINTTTICPFYINTGMFDGVKSGNPLLPILDPKWVVRSIIKAVKTNSHVVYLPFMVKLIFIMRYVPEEWRDWIDSRLVGLSRSMDEFHGIRKLK